MKWLALLMFSSMLHGIGWYAFWQILEQEDEVKRAVICFIIFLTFIGNQVALRKLAAMLYPDKLQVK